MGSAYLENHPTTACPASWYATFVFSSSERTLLLFSIPPMILSIALSKSSKVTNVFSPFKFFLF